MSITITHRLPALASGSIAVASVIGADPAGWYPFGPAKWYAVLVCVVLAVWATLSLPPGRVHRLPTYARLLWAALLALLVISAVAGREPIYAWIGTPERRLGVIAWVVMATCCWLGARVSSAVDRRTVGRVVTVAALLNGIYCAVELVFNAPINVTNVGQRIGGPYGSAAFLGAALCLLVPVPIAVAADRTEHSAWRYLGAGAGILGLFALIGSGTRASVLGLTAAALVFGAARLVGRATSSRSETKGAASPEPSDDAAHGASAADLDQDTVRSTTRSTIRAVMGRPHRLATAGLAIVALMLVMVVANRANDELGGQAAANVGRVANINSSSRMDEWAVGMRIVAAHPVLGVGPEGYRTALADGITPRYERTYGREVLPDRAHNAVIDVAAAGGVVAGGVYFAMLVVASWAAWVCLCRRFTLTAGCAVAVIAYATQQMFLFPVATIDPVFWLFAGILLGVRGATAAAAPDDASGSDDAASDGEPRPGPRQVPRRIPRRAVDVGAAVMLVMVVASAALGIAADRLARRAEAEQSVELAHRATELRPDIVRYWLLAERTEPMTITGIKDALADIERARAVSPHDPVVARRHAERLLDLAIATGARSDVDAAVEAWSQVASDVNCYRCQLGLGYALANAGRLRAAVSAFETADALAPDGDNEAARNATIISERLVSTTR